MNIEEKAKAYDEAMNKIKPLYEQAKRDGNPIWSTYEYLIPELHKEEKPLTPFQQCLNCILRGVYYAEVPDKKVNEFILNVVRTRTDELIKLAKRHEDTDCQLRENEDERIRKALIDALKVSETIGELKFRLPYPTREECIAYLEKQKEYHIPWYDYQKSKEAGYTIVPNEEYEQLIKQKEQKPEDKEITLTNFEEVLNTFLFDFANSPIEDCEPKEYTKKHSAEILKAAYAELNAQLKQDIFEAQQEGRREGYEAAKAEQKPAEIDFEDWDTLGYIRDIVRKHVRRDEEFSVLDKWLTEHYVNQKPAWSEEEQKFLRVAISCTYDRGYLSVSNWLKSLRPSWKPSKEQIEALRYVAYEHGNSSLSPYSIANKTLASLYEQLKKL